MHILIVEPDALLAHTYSQALHAAGHTTTDVRTAQAAVHAADEQQPDVVVLELQLPVHNGVEFLYEFRSYPEWLHIPVLIQSFVPPHEYNHAVTLEAELGVKRFLYKPTTSLKQFVAAVGTLQPAEVV